MEIAVHFQVKIERKIEEKTNGILNGSEKCSGVASICLVSFLENERRSRFHEFSFITTASKCLSDLYACL